MTKELNNYLKNRICEISNITLEDKKGLMKFHNTIIKYLDMNIQKIIENPKIFESLFDVIINEICYNTFILINYSQFPFLLTDYLNNYYTSYIRG